MKKINKIKSGLISRQIGVAKLAFKTGRNLILNRDQDLKTKLKDGIAPHVDSIVSELGVMKGSLMKAGQMLSTYAGSFLPPEAQAVLKELENQSSFLEFEQIKDQIPPHFLEELDIDPTPIAAASLGQVHLAKKGDQIFAMKIQYKGVKKAIKNDIRALKLLLKVLNVIPKEVDLTEVYQEIEEMLRQETDYKSEAENTKMFSKLLADYPQFRVPQVIDEYSTDSILTTEYLKGHSLREIERLNLSQKQRNQLGEDFMRLLFLELFKFELVQTDVHMGNYLILPDNTWGLIDFGASKQPPKEFLKGYQKLLIACSELDREAFFKNLYQMHYLSSDKKTNEDFFWEYAQVIAQPFQQKVYDWGASEIADQVFDYAPKLVQEVSIGNPPRHTIFLDRKIGGVFFILQELGAQFAVKELFTNFDTDLKSRQ